MNNCLIIAGEKSGEDHVMSFLPTIMEGNQDLHFWGVGGDDMKSHGIELLYHLRDFSSWGFSGVIQKIPFYKRALDHICEQAAKRNCKVAILVDFQDFNMRLAKRLKKLGVKVLYYVAPQAWAWKAGRVVQLRENVHTLFTILPFEKKWFIDRGVNQVISVSHPLFVRYRQESLKPCYSWHHKSYEWLMSHPNLLLLPGSRNFEVSNLLPKFIEAVKSMGRPLHLGLVKSSSVDPALYEPFERYIDYLYEDSELDRALEWAGIALAASGTVTLTCALFQVPTVMTYQSSLLNEYIFYELLSYDGHISLPNIIFDDEVFPELIQNRATAYNMKTELEKLLTDSDHYLNVKKTLARTRELIKGDVEETGQVMSSVIAQT